METSYRSAGRKKVAGYGQKNSEGKNQESGREDSSEEWVVKRLLPPRDPLAKHGRHSLYLLRQDRP